MARERALTRQDIYGVRRTAASEDRQIAVGAYARKVFRQRLVLGGVGLALLAGAAWIYLAFSRGEAHAVPKQRDAIVRCGECDATQRVRLAVTGGFPVRCEKCGRPAARELWKCRSCQSEFVPADAGPSQACPKCQSLAVGAAAADA